MRRTRRRWTVLVMAVSAGVVLLVAPQVSGQPERLKEGGPRSEPGPMRFVLTVDATKAVTTFDRLAILATEIDVSEYMASSDEKVVAKRLPARLMPPTIVLSRDRDDNADLWGWHLAARRGDGQARQDMTLEMLDSRGTPVVRYRLHRAWPSSIALTARKLGDAEVLEERVTLEADDLQRVSR